jgi:hypothetical protein
LCTGRFLAHADIGADLVGLQVGVVFHGLDDHRQNHVHHRFAHSIKTAAESLADTLVDRVLNRWLKISK